ncbi:unnamed protein product, partial [Owenia fusiformis]
MNKIRPMVFELLPGQTDVCTDGGVPYIPPNFVRWDNNSKVLHKIFRTLPTVTVVESCIEPKEQFYWNYDNKKWQSKLSVNKISRNVNCNLDYNNLGTLMYFYCITEN